MGLFYLNDLFLFCFCLFVCNFQKSTQLVLMVTIFCCSLFYSVFPLLCFNNYDHNGKKVLKHTDSQTEKFRVSQIIQLYVNLLNSVDRVGLKPA